MENQPPSSSAEKLVLVVDDDRGVRELLQIILQKEGFRSESAEDGAEALEKARALHPDLILLDLMLPKANGLEIVRELQMDDTGDIPIIIMTGRFMDRSTAEMIKHERNVKEYLEKPVKTALLAALLHKLLNTRPPAKKPA
ncbi:MAG: response regulator [Elusimicrobiales bacterium]